MRCTWTISSSHFSTSGRYWGRSCGDTQLVDATYPSAVQFGGRKKNALAQQALPRAGTGGDQAPRAGPTIHEPRRPSTAEGPDP